MSFLVGGCPLGGIQLCSLARLPSHAWVNRLPGRGDGAKTIGKSRGCTFALRVLNYVSCLWAGCKCEQNMHFAHRIPMVEVPQVCLLLACLGSSALELFCLAEIVSLVGHQLIMFAITIWSNVSRQASRVKIFQGQSQENRVGQSS